MLGFHKPSMYVTGGVTEKGVTHVRKNMPNQDAFRCLERPDYTILAIADGHGSQMHFRSAIGSTFAVEVAVKHLTAYAQTLDKQYSVEELELLKKEIYSDWVDACKTYTIEHPIEIETSSKEIHRIDKGRTSEKVSEYKTKDFERNIILNEREALYVLSHPITVYGSTLIASLVTKEGTVILKLGDGDLRLVYKELPFQIFEDEPELYGNQTFSLSSKDALEHFQITYLDIHPDMIYMSTDGVINSYADTTDYHILGTELLKSYLNHQDTFDQELKTLIHRFAHDGSGDDCTICYAIHKKYLLKGETHGIK